MIQQLLPLFDLLASYCYFTFCYLYMWICHLSREHVPSVNLLCTFFWYLDFSLDVIFCSVVLDPVPIKLSPTGSSVHHGPVLGCFQPFLGWFSSFCWVCWLRFAAVAGLLFCPCSCCWCSLLPVFLCLLRPGGFASCCVAGVSCCISGRCYLVLHVVFVALFCWYSSIACKLLEWLMLLLFYIALYLLMLVFPAARVAFAYV